MRNHRVDSQAVSANVKLEVIHESNPYFAGESIQVLIRLKHLGSVQAKDQSEIKLQELRQKQQDIQKEANQEKRKSWTVKSLWGSPDSEEKAANEKIQASISHLEKELKFNSPVRLASCYTQIYGCFQYDPEMINSKEFEHQDHHRLAGVGSLKLSEGKNSIAESFAGLLFSNIEDVARESISGPTVELIKVPFFLIPQTLIFSETMLDPGQTRTFQFKSPRLPQDLTPSYQSSKQLKIQYFLSFGLTEIESTVIKPFSAEFSVHVCPFVDVYGRQLTSKLDTDISITAPGRAKEIKDNLRSRRKSSSSIVLRRRSSVLSISASEVKGDVNSECKKLFTQLISAEDSSAVLADSIEGLVDQMIECQFGVDTFDTSEDDDENITNDLSQGSVRKDAVSVRKNLGSLFRNLGGAPSSRQIGEGIDASESTNMISQVKRLQKEYIINRDGVFIAKVILSNLFYTTADDIDLTIQLGNVGPHKVSAITTSLKSIELVNPKYCIDPTSNGSKMGKIVDQSRAICFDELSTIQMKLIPQKSPSRQMTSQFKSDIFQFKWMLCLKFVLISRNDMPELMQKFYEDKNGSLYHAKHVLDGEEFICHLPLTILPTSKNFGGW
ncbi:LAFA_0E04698g1_1 [Lachancea sp. 'fantastica']|nr:LAFA_0E04698g1_1 [Lachancea sp. 'fantastica']